MLALEFSSRFRGLTPALLIFLLSGALAHAQISGSNPTVGTTTKTLSPTDVFTGTLSVGVNGSSGGTLNLIIGNFPAATGQVFSFAGNGSYLSYTGLGSPPTLTIASGASLTRSGATAGYTYVYDNLANSGTVTVSGGTLQFQSNTTLTNNSGATTTVSGLGSTLSLVGLANSGTVAVNSGGLVQLTSAYTSANLGTFTIASGGTVQLTNGATVNNVSATITAPTTGAFTLFGGTITGGSIPSAALVFSSSGGVLDGAIINGNLSLGSGETVTLKNNAGFTGTGSVNTGTLYLSSNLSLAAGNSLTFTGNGSYLSYTALGSPPTLTVPSGASLTRSGASGYTYVYDNLANSGTVTVSGGTLQFQSNTTLTNNAGATTTVSGAGSTLYLPGLANSGTVAVDTNGLVQLAGAFTSANLGTFSIASGGTVQLTNSATVNNVSATLPTPTTGAFTLFGGTITGGNIPSAALAFSSSGGVLDGATLNGNLSLGSGETVTLKNNAGFTGTGSVNTGAFYLASNLSLAASNSLTFTGNGSSLSYTALGAPPTLTLPSGASLTRSGATPGYTYVYDNLANSGTVTVSGGTLQFQGNTTLTNNAGATTTVTGVGSTLYLFGLANAGTVAVNSGGLVQLAGNFTSANLGAFTLASGGAVQLTGTLTNTTLPVPAGGAYTLLGGTITGGTISAGAVNFTNSGGYLDGASLVDNLTIPANAYVRFINGANFTNPTLSLAANAGLYWQQAGTLASKAITFAPNSYLYVAGANHTLTLDSTSTATGQIQIYTDGSVGAAITTQGTITHNNTGSGSIYAPAFTNSGAIIGNTGTLYLGYPSAGYNSTNTATGTITATGSDSVVYVRGNFTNAGTLSAQNSGWLLFDGTNTAGNLGNVQLSSGGRALLNGTLTNTALTAPTGGTFELYGGTITGGTIAPGALSFTTSGGYLDGAVLNDNLTLAAGAYVRFSNNTSFTGATATIGANSALYWQQAGTLTGKAITLGSGAYIYVNGASNTLTLGPTTTITGDTNLYTDGSVGAAITTQGTITHNVATSGSIYAPTFTNSGSILASAGTLYLGYPSAGYNSTNASGGTITSTGSGTTIYLRGNFTNSGTLLAQNSGLLLFDGVNSSGNLGTVQLSTGGRALLNGTLTNTALTAPTGGTFELYGGTITGGTIAAGALSFTSSGGYLDNTSLLDNLTLGTNAYVRFINGASFSGSTATFAASSGVYWQQVGTLTGKSLTLGSGAYLYLSGANTALTLSPSTSLSGVANVYTDGSAGTAITNLGTITHNSGSSGSIYASTFTNSGAITASAGTLYLGYPSAGYNSTNTSGGTITATGSGTTVYVRGNFTNSGTLSAQNSGLLLFDGANTTGNLGNVQISTGGRALLNGTITNTNLTAPTGGTFELYGGTIQGGTIAANALSFTSSGGYLDNTSLLDNLTLGTNSFVRFINGASFTGSTATFAASSGVYWQQVGTLTGKALTLGSGAYLYLSGANTALTLSPSTSLSGVANVYTDGSAGTAITNLGTITHNSSSSGSIYASTFTNSGAITASASTLYLGYPSAGYNSTNTSGGTITATGSGTTVYVRGNFTNSGTLSAQNSALLLFDGTNSSGNLGTVTLSTGGRALLNGTLTNTALTAPTGGTFELYGGTIQGGTIAANTLSFTSSGGYLDGTTLNDNLTLGASSYVRFLNNAVFTGATGTFAANSGVYWQQSGTLAGKTLTFGSNAYLYVVGANHALTLSPSTTVTGSVNVYSDGSVGTAILNQGSITHTNTGSASLYANGFTNSGSISATAGTLYLGYPSTNFTFTNAASGLITVNGSAANVWLQAPTATPFLNNGTINVQSGTLTVTSPFTNAGTVSVGGATTFNGNSSTLLQTAGLLKVDGSFVAPSTGLNISGGSVTGAGSISGNVTFNGGSLDPGGPIGTLTFAGNLTLTGGAITNLELGAGVNDRVTVSGSGNSLKFGGTLNILAISTAFASGQTWTVFSFPAQSGTFSLINLPYTGSGWVWDTTQLTTTGALTLTTFVAVPEPSTYALLAAGLGLVWLVRRRASLRR